MRRSQAKPRASWLLLAIGSLAALATLVGLAGASSAGGSPEYMSGSLTVLSGQTQVYTNRTLVISGDILVQSGGTLELHNASLLLNLTADFSFSLTVQGGAALRAFDLDGSAQTGLDRSLIASANPAYRYAARFEAGSNVSFRGSALSGFGRSLAAPGLVIESDTVTFVGSSLEAYAYLRVEGVSPVFEGTTLAGDGTGSNYFFGSSSTLMNCTFSKHFVAVRAGNGSALTVGGALVRDSIFAFAANNASLAVAGAVVNNSTTHVFLNTSAATLTDVDFDPGRVTFDDATSVLTLLRSFTFRVINAAAEAVRNATVVVRDGANATVTTGNTGSVGAVGPVALVASVINASGRLDAANYTVSAAKVANLTSFNFSPLTQASPITLALSSNIDPRLSVTAPSSGAVLLAAVDATFVANATDADATPGGVTVTWRSSLQGPLGSGLSLPVTLTAGLHTIVVEARDGQDGFRQVTFNVTVEVGQAETLSLVDGALTYSVTVWKTSSGTWGATVIDAPSLSPFLVGRALDVHATSGYLVVAWVRVRIPYDEAAVPYGCFEQGLTVERAGTGNVSGATLNLSGDFVLANVSGPAGLGTYYLLATKGPNLPPEFPALPRLSAVVGQPFTVTVAAVDTPGDTLRYTLGTNSSWLTIEPGTGTISGTPGEGDRGVNTVMIVANDPGLAYGGYELQVFVSGTVANRPPQLVNPTFDPASPTAGERVAVSVTYFDPDGDYPFYVELIVDGTAHTMEPAVLEDVNVSDGKVYTFGLSVGAGAHNLSFRASDGAPGHEDVTVAVASFSVAPDSLRALNNWFLALLASVALTLVIVLFLRARAPPKASKKAAVTPEDRPTFVEGAALKPIAPQAKIAQRTGSREASLAREAELRAQEAEKDERAARRKLAGEEE